MKSIAISYAGYNKKVGDCFLVGIQVDDSWFNIFRDYWNKRTLSLRLKRGILFSKLDKKLLNHQIRKTNEYTIINQYFSIINSFRKFWECQIYIEMPQLDISEDEFIELMNEERSINLKAKNIDFKDCKIKFEPHKSIALAWALAKEYEYKQMEDIKNVWGQIGDGSNSDNLVDEFIAKNPDAPNINKNRRIGG